MPCPRYLPVCYGLSWFTTMFPALPSVYSSSEMDNAISRLLDSLFSCHVTIGNDARASCWTSKLKENEFDNIKFTMLTLHFLFPHELLPALDLLDRKLLLQLLLPRADDNHLVVFGAEQSEPARPNMSDFLETFYIQSASAVTQKFSKTSRFRKVFNNPENFYETRLDSWNCTCPAFAFSAFGNSTLLDDISKSQCLPGRHLPNDLPAGIPRKWQFGGVWTSHANEIPICKHILAAALSRAASGLFPEALRCSMITVSEAAGWAGGWGE